MQQNNNKGPKRPILVQQDRIREPAQKRHRAAPSKQTVAEHQTVRSTTQHAMAMANSREPSLQDRAERQRIAQMQSERDGHQPTQTMTSQHHRDERKQKNRKQNKKAAIQQKQPGLIDHFFVRANTTPGVTAPDYVIIEIVAVLLAIGLVMVFSASSYRSLLEYGNTYSYFIRQCAAAVLGIVAAFFVIMLSPDVLRRLAPIFLFFVLLLLIYTLFAGEESLGATRWVTIAGIRFQPSEMAKPLMVICTADLIKNGAYGFVFDEGGWIDRNNLIVFAMIVASFGVIAVEDLGSAIAVFGGCFAMFIVGGLTRRWIAGIIALGVGVVGIYIALEPYRIQRLFGFINQTDADAASGSAYQLVQSLYAFGSGGLFGVGLGNSGQKLYYLPEMHTDFIYSVIGEEFGIIGALLVLGLFLALAWRGFWLSTRIADPFKSYLCFGATAIIVVQALINMAVASGVFPVTGITLPLISYGGTSLVITLLNVGLILNASRYADKSKRKRTSTYKMEKE